MGRETVSYLFGDDTLVSVDIVAVEGELYFWEGLSQEFLS
jgi:hypothetical protein